MDSLLNTVPGESGLVDKLVLIVEDDIDLRQTIQWMLEDEGFVVETAGDGKEALERAARRKPALVLLDMGLPIIDGFGVADGLHTAYGDTVKILTLTADGRAAEKSRRIGAIGYLNKPFDLDALILAVQEALSL